EANPGGGDCRVVSALRKRSRWAVSSSRPRAVNNSSFMIWPIEPASARLSKPDGCRTKAPWPRSDAAGGKVEAGFGEGFAQGVGATPEIVGVGRAKDEVGAGSALAEKRVAA